MQNPTEWNSAVYANGRDLDQKINDERNHAMKPLVNIYIETALRDLSIYLTKQYGFREEKDWVTFYKLDSPHPKFTNYKKQTDLIDKEFKSYKPGMNIQDARQRIQPAMDYFADQVSKLNKNDKQQYKLLKHTLINLFQFHFYLDDYDGFKKYGYMYSRLEEDSEWEDHRLLNLEKLHKSMKACGTTSLYYVRDLTDVKPIAANNPSIGELYHVTRKVRHQGWHWASLRLDRPSNAMPYGFPYQVLTTAFLHCTSNLDTAFTIYSKVFYSP